MVSKIEKVIMMLEANIHATNETLIVKTGIFLTTNKRQDRDSVIKLKSRLDTYNDILKQINNII